MEEKDTPQNYLGISLSVYLAVRRKRPISEHREGAFMKSSNNMNTGADTLKDPDSSGSWKFCISRKSISIELEVIKFFQ